MTQILLQSTKLISKVVLALIITVILAVGIFLAGVAIYYTLLSFIDAAAASFNFLL